MRAFGTIGGGGRIGYASGFTILLLWLEGSFLGYTRFGFV